MSHSTPADADAAAHVFVGALDDRCEITGTDGHHLQRVRRLAPGERVTAADGSGAWREYDVVDAADARLVLQAAGDTCVEPSPRVGVALAVALAKHGLDVVVASVTELGVTRITPVRTERTVVRWDAPRAAKALGRLRAIARESAMQSRRARVPEIDDVVELDGIANRAGLVVADRAGLPAEELPAPRAPGWTVLVGPEGGLSPAELARLAGVPRLGLGRNVLRAATAPVAAVAVLAARTARLSPE